MTLNVYDVFTDTPTLIEDQALLGAKVVEVNAGEERGGISFLEITFQIKDGRQITISTDDDGKSFPLAYWGVSDHGEGQA